MSRGIYDKVNKVRIPTCGKEKFDVDNALSPTSKNAVQNRVVNNEFENLRDQMAGVWSVSGETATFSFNTN